MPLGFTPEHARIAARSAPQPPRRVAIDHPNDEAGEISMRRAGREHQQRRDKVAANLAKRAGA